MGKGELKGRNFDERPIWLFFQFWEVLEFS
jgi:hypothetical protein